MTDERRMLDDTCERLFAAHLDDAVHRAAADGEWPAALWDAIAEAGLDRVLVPEEAGGIGMGWEEAHVVLHAAGAHAVPAPLAEAVVAGWQLADCGLKVPDGVLTLADGDANTLRLLGARVEGRLERVPWGRVAHHVVALGNDHGTIHAAVIAPGAGEATADRNIAGEPRDALALSGAAVLASARRSPAMDGMPATLPGAVARSCQMAGAVSAVLDIAVEYAGERVQFGRPLAKFQAIQQQLAVLAGEAAAAEMAARRACRAMDRLRGDRLAGVDASDSAAFAAILAEVATAKIRTGEAAGKAAAVAHQVLGAIGFTEEHRLHRLTRRLWAWRAESGSETAWANLLGRLVIARGAGSLWPDITARG